MHYPVKNSVWSCFLDRRCCSLHKQYGSLLWVIGLRLRAHASAGRYLSANCQLALWVLFRSLGVCSLCKSVLFDLVASTFIDIKTFTGNFQNKIGLGVTRKPLVGRSFGCLISC